MFSSSRLPARLRQSARRILPGALLLIFILSAAGCETLQFYRQAAWGQWQLMQARQPVTRLVADETTAPELALRLNLIGKVLEFSERELGLTVGGRYSSYVALPRDYVLWNVFAAGPYSLDDDQWCYPIVGCAPYRGYFNRDRAYDVAQRYARDGMETYVAGVPAYSTLGWFNDPILSSFIFWPEADLVNLLIHELAHGKVWVNGDAGFNESFAEFVGNAGARQWFEAVNRADQWQDWLDRRRGWRRFRDFTVQAKQHLQIIYSGPRTDMEIRKEAAYADLRACYQHHRGELGNGRYDQLMNEHFNNAFLLSVATYADWLPGFSALFEAAGGNWTDFFKAVEELAQRSRGERDDALARLTEQQIAQGADDKHAEDINCEAFLSHGAHGETAG